MSDRVELVPCLGELRFAIPQLIPRRPERRVHVLERGGEVRQRLQLGDPKRQLGHPGLGASGALRMLFRLPGECPRLGPGRLGLPARRLQVRLGRFGPSLGSLDLRSELRRLGLRPLDLRLDGLGPRGGGLQRRLDRRELVPCLGEQRISIPQLIPRRVE
jgi:hypothetical protein